MNIVFHHRTRGKGAEGVHIMGVVNGLRQLGHQVSILSLPGADPEAPPAPVEPARRPSGGALKALLEQTRHFPEWLFELVELAYNLVALWRLRRRVAAQQAQLVYERYSLFMVAPLWWARRRGVPMVLEINDSCLVERVRPLFFQALARRIERWVFRHANGLVFISGHFQQLAQQQYGDIAPSVVSPNAADLDQFKPDLPAAAKLRDALGVADKVVLGYVGAFVHWHGIDWFVDHIADRLSAVPELVLLLVGDGACFEAIAERVRQADIEAQVILTGRVPHQQVANYIAAMDFGVLPDSNDYGSPMKLFEFMAMGKAMVVPDFSPIREVVQDDETGWLFAAGDRDACIERVLMLAADAAARQRVGRQAREYIERERQWRHNAEQLLSLVS